MTNESEYAGMVRKALERVSRGEVSMTRVSEDEFRYSTKIENKEGTVFRSMDVMVDAVQCTIDMRICVEAGICSKCSVSRLYELMNELEAGYLYSRIYIDRNGDLKADYRTLIETTDAQGSGLFEKSLQRLFCVLTSVFMTYTEQVEKFITENDGRERTVTGRSITEEQINLNPFAG